jgi:2-pyrone-4,6-dicarboxylate lactonase
VFEILPPLLPQIKSGWMRALAVTGDKRFPGLPNVPTAAESGLKDYQVKSWNGLSAPAGTPPAVVERLNKEINAIVAMPDVRQKLLDLGVEARGVDAAGAQSIAGRGNRQVEAGCRAREDRETVMRGCDVEFTKTPGWLDWYAGPAKPAFKVPPGSVDAHCHVFGPGKEFPFAPERKYTPCDASKAQLYALRDHLGFARNVVVQATCHGADNSAMVDAVKSSNGRARGVATVRRDITDAQLRELHDAGVRGVRFNFVKRLVDFTPKDELNEIAGRIHEARMARRHLLRALDLPELWDFFTGPSRRPSSSITWAGPTSAKPVDGPEFELFVKVHARQRQRLEQGRAVPSGCRCAGPPALTASATRIATCSRSPRASSRRFPTACCGAPTGRIPISRTTCPTTGCSSTSFRTSHPHRNCSASCSVDNPMRLYWPEEV